MNLKTLSEVSRAPFFIAVIIPALLGGVIAGSSHGTISFFLLFLIIIGLTAAHGGANIANDYFDFHFGTDAINKERTPFSGGNFFLPEGKLKPGTVLFASLFFYGIAFIICIYLTLTVGLFVLFLGLIGGFIGFFYTAPPLKLGYHGLGELLVGLSFGPLPALGTYYVLTHEISVLPVVASIPVGILIATVLFVNEIPDYHADKKTGKNHLVVRLGGKEKAVKIIPVFFFFAYLSIIAGVITNTLPMATLISLLTIPLACKVILIAKENFNDTQKYIPAMAETIKIHAFTGLLLVAGYLIWGFPG